MRNLLRRPEPALLRDVAKALASAAEAFVVPKGHRADLPLAVQGLSRLLTRERGELGRSYWSAPRFLAAYIHYFLPWNLYRLAWLLPDLDLLPDPLPEGELRLLDLGSGPLTLPLALWCARPDLRGRSLRIVCADLASRPMEVGRDALRNLAGNASPWRVDLARIPLEKALGGKEYQLILAGNVLNEIRPGRGQAREEKLEALFSAMNRALRPDGRVFLLEPGTRLGGQWIAQARAAALNSGFFPLSPCPHRGPCPMPGQLAAAAFTGWCHFSAPAIDIPKPLLALGRQARLEKETLALSCILLGRGVAEDPKDQEGGRRGMPEQSAGGRENSLSSGFARIISQPIHLPDRSAPARYACCARGLALALDASALPSGGATRLCWPAEGERDRKSGALLCAVQTHSARKALRNPNHSVRGRRK
ncbi:MAG: hypothetical protein LBJ82_02595 [Deltaproteobacteria bacterium]|jgi:SAM-dependent methyltransferase|nr:hypothetical protein [Deltaproteobacteria bacterium]